MRRLLLSFALIATAVAAAPPTASAELLGSGSDGIWLVSDDGATRSLLSTRYVSDATWSADGERIVFSHFRDDAWRLLAGPPSGPFAEIPGSAGLQDPAWSADGSSIAAFRAAGELSEIVVLPAAGGAPRTVTTGAADHSPTWSPDGTQIAFVRETALMVVRADGSEPRELTKDAESPSWSPDGRTIAFATTRDANGETCENEGTEDAFCRPNAEIYTIGADGTGERRVTDSPADDGWPAWSPDSARIAFASDRHWLTQELYVMDADGTCVTQLTLGAGFVIAPEWRPGRLPIGRGACGVRRATYTSRLSVRVVPLFPGLPYRGMLPTEARRGYLVYDECGAARRAQCIGRIELTAYTTCRSNPARGTARPERIETIRGTLVLFYADRARVLSGGTTTEISADAGLRPMLRRVVRALRPTARPASAPRRLARPQLPPEAWAKLARSRRPDQRQALAALRRLGAGRRPACAR
jgi:TolB protein